MTARQRRRAHAEQTNSHMQIIHGTIARIHIKEKRYNNERGV